VVGVEGTKLTRRGSLVGFGGFLLGALGWRAASSEGAGPTGVASGAVSCVLAPEQTEGPYYLAGEKLRRDITEGRPGVPLLLRLKVVDASTCRPIKGAAVDIWHADALGVYSGSSGSGNRTFMRGVQRTDSYGLARFRSVYPGWYRGRTVHIHVKVHVAGNVVHTGQLYFADPVTDRVFKRKPYSRRGRRSTRNGDDFVFAHGGRRSLLSLRRTGTTYVGSITMGVSR
jgi:hypothetical protein